MNADILYRRLEGQVVANQIDSIYGNVDNVDSIWSR